MHLLYGAAAVKNIDCRCEKELGIPVMTLMARAGESLYKCLVNIRTKNGIDGQTVIVCGGGNNGGDGYALACLMAEKGERPQLVALVAPAAGEPARFAIKLGKMGIKPILYSEQPNLCEEMIRSSSLVVDCIFGSSFDATRPVYNAFARLCGAIEDSRSFVLSADMPSGVSASDGTVSVFHDLPCCVKADATLCFAPDKVGLHTYPGALYAGEVFFDDIGIPSAAIHEQDAEGWLLDEQTATLLPKRNADSHKGTYGKLLLFCGNPDMTGAAVLATGGALRSGAGLVTCMGMPSVLDVIKRFYPEPIYRPLEETLSGDVDAAGAATVLDECLQGQTAILAGCGIGTSLGCGKVLVHLLKNAACPLILDADALNILSSDAGLAVLRGAASRVPVIVTPHPGEMARLTGATTADVQQNRVVSALRFAKNIGCFVVLKGAGTVVASPDGRFAVNASGNPGMAKGGMGDLLAGFVAGFAAQKIAPFEAACIGVYYHGKAGDFARAIHSEYGMLPRDVEGLLGKAMAHSFKA